MSVNCAAAICVIENATLQQQREAEQFVESVISTTLKDFEMPEGDAARAELVESLVESGKQLMLEHLQQ